MKVLMTFFVMIILMVSCTTNSTTANDPICNCYDQFVKEIDRQKIDLDAADISEILLKIYIELAAKDSEFLKCTDNTIFNGDLFTKSKLRMYGSMNPGCVDVKKLKKIADKGPYLYKTEF